MRGHEILEGKERYWDRMVPVRVAVFISVTSRLGMIDSK